MYFQAFSVLILALCATQALAIDFSNSKWIWTNEVNTAGVAPPGSRAFRRDFYSPQGRTALSANIIIAADNEYILYVNGKQIGNGTSFTTADAYCIRLAPDCNVFAVNATNELTVPNPAGLLATIQIRYTDGFSDTIVTDGEWHSFTSVPAGFQEITFDDSAWPAASVEANFGALPWGDVSIPASASVGSTTLELTDANWIWTNEVSSGANVAPNGARAFRKVVNLPAGQAATSATILIAVDNEYTLYFQGRVVGSGTSWPSPQRYVVDILPPASEITVAVYGFNTGGPAGLIAAVELTMEDCDCGSVTSFVTDSTWKFSTSIPAGFELPGFDDSAWKNAVNEGKFGVGPWTANLNIPTKVSPASAPLPGAPAANTADVVT